LINLVGTDPVTKLPSASFPASPSTIANGWPCGAVSISGTSFPLVATELASYIDPVSGIDYGDVRGSRRSVDRGALTLNYGFGDGYQLTSQTAYTRTATNAGTDQSYGGTALALGTSWLSYTRDKLNYKSQEIRLTSPLDADLTWAVGAFYYKEEADGLTTNLLVQKGAAVVPDTMRLKPASTIENMAPFATVQYQFNKQLRMSFEGRYSSERVQVGGPPRHRRSPPALGRTPCGITGDRTFTDFAPRVTVDYKLNKETMLYAQVAKGSKAGGFNTLPGLAANYLTFEGERIRATEIGAKSRLLGGRLLVNLALFENDISGLRCRTPSPSSTRSRARSRTTRRRSTSARHAHAGSKPKSCTRPLSGCSCPATTPTPTPRRWPAPKPPAVRSSAATCRWPASRCSARPSTRCPCRRRWICRSRAPV
jgi:outer membrane receptor protein involved in Fe transport